MWYGFCQRRESLSLFFAKRVINIYNIKMFHNYACISGPKVKCYNNEQIARGKRFFGNNAFVIIYTVKRLNVKSQS